MQVSNRALQTLADALRHHRTILGSRWRRLPAGRQALLVLAHLNNGETYTALAGGFGVGTSTACVAKPHCSRHPPSRTGMPRPF